MPTSTPSMELISTFPSATDIVSSSTAMVTPFFDSFTQFAWLMIGVFIAALAVLFIVRQVRTGASLVLGHRRRGRRR